MPETDDDEALDVLDPDWEPEELLCEAVEEAEVTLWEVEEPLFDAGKEVEELLWSDVELEDGTTEDVELWS